MELAEERGPDPLHEVLEGLQHDADYDGDGDDSLPGDFRVGEDPIDEEQRQHEDGHGGHFEEEDAGPGGGLADDGGVGTF